MSDLNLENIVGFKAVDKDGNEQNVTVDEMVDMVSTRMVMALSETSTFAAAAATGNDVYENELPTVTDAANVRVLQSSGDAAKMTMQSLASKLGELMNSLGLFPFMRRLNYYDLDDINLESGIYGINNTGGRKDAPSNDSTGISLGMIIIFNGKGMSLGGNPVVQIAVEYMANSIKVRTYWSTKWYEWVQIATL